MAAQNATRRGEEADSWAADMQVPSRATGDMGARVASEPTGQRFVGYKRGWLVLELKGGQLGHVKGSTAVPEIVDVGFCGHRVALTYRKTSEAVCGQGFAHAGGTIEHCVCGFYALKSRQAIQQYKFAGSPSELGGRSSTLLEVQFYGEVFEGEAGWRGSRQQVISCELDPVCSWCSQPATRIVGGKVWNVTLSGALVWAETSCRACSDTYGHGEYLAPTQLAELLGIDVFWGEIDEGIESVRAKERDH